MQITNKEIQKAMLKAVELKEVSWYSAPNGLDDVLGYKHGINEPIRLKQENVHQIVSQIRQDDIDSLIEWTESRKRYELQDVSIQALDRYQREEYGEQVIGYNEALSEVIEYLKETKKHYELATKITQTKGN